MWRALMYRRRSQSTLVGTFHGRKSPLMKTGLFRQVMDLKIKRKNPGGALRRVASLLGRAFRFFSWFSYDIRGLKRKCFLPVLYIR
jgi:hypothetical protein